MLQHIKQQYHQTFYYYIYPYFLRVFVFMLVRTPCACRCLQVSEESVGSFGTGVTDGGSSPVGVENGTQCSSCLSSLL